MGKNPLQEVLNKLFRDTRINKNEYTIVYRDLAESSGEKSIPFNHVFQIDRFGINILGSDYIPLHKIICIKYDGNTVWERRRNSN